MPNIGNAVFVDYKILSFLFYLIRNRRIFLLIFQPSEFLTTYTIVITRLLPYFRPRFSVLSLKKYSLIFDIHPPLVICVRFNIRGSALEQDESTPSHQFCSYVSVFDIPAKVKLW